MQENRRKAITAAFAAVAAGGAAQAQSKTVKKVYSKGPKPTGTPLYSPAVSYGNLLFLAGKGGREGDVKAQTKWVLEEIQKELENRRVVDGEGAEGERVFERHQGFRIDERGVRRPVRRRAAGSHDGGARGRTAGRCAGGDRRRGFYLKCARRKSTT